MHLRKNAAALLLGLATLLVVLTAGCGGGGQSGGQSEDPSEGQQGGQQQDGQQGDSQGDNQGGSQGDSQGGGNGAGSGNSKIALGSIQAVDEGERRISLQPALQDSEPMDFKLRKGATISLNGQSRELGEVQEGQQAQVEYVEARRGPDRAVSIELFAESG